MISHRLPDECLRALLPRPVVNSAEWCAANIRMPTDSKLAGNFSLDLFPWMRTLFEAFDDPEISRITLQSAAQLGKTTFAFGCVTCAAANNPHPMCWAEPDKHSLERVIGRLWRMFERTNGLSHQCPPKSMQGSRQVETGTFLIHGAYPRSPATTADFGAWVIVLNETNKFQKPSTSKEADARFLLRERAKGIPGAKIIQISTPTEEGDDFIESQRLQGDNRSWQVECPHCGHYQQLKTGDGGRTEPGGIRFEKLNGVLNADHAKATAWYECEKCLGRIEEHQRYAMLHTGLWVPEGCRVEDRKITGTPVRPGSHASFGPLPTLASLLPEITIGSVAYELVDSMTAQKDRGERLRNFTNSWEGRSFNPRPKAAAAHELKARLSVNEPAQVCPEWSRLLVACGDVGRINDELLFYWGVSAWARVNAPGRQWGRRGQLVDRGLTIGEKAFREQIAKWLAEGYPHADGGPPMRVRRVGLDSGSGTEANRVYEFCQSLSNVWPLKGSSTHQFPGLFDLGFQSVNVPPKLLQARRKAGLADLIIINTQRTQQWRQDLVSGLIKRDEPSWYSIPDELCEDDLLDELQADYYDVSKGTWERAGANESGDWLRYTYAFAEWIATKDGEPWLRYQAAIPRRPPAAPTAAQKQAPPSDKLPPERRRRTPTGKAFVASQR